MGCGDVGIRLQSPVSFGAASPRVETVSIPGRNGDLHIFDGSFANIEGKASCFALEAKRVNEALNAVNRWCFLQPGYRRLEVSDEPMVYRRARPSIGPENAIRMRHLAPFELTFDCDPRKFYKAGERVLRLTKSGAALKNTGFPAAPLVTVYGSGAGTLEIGGVTVQLLAIDESIVLDCDTQNAYKGTMNENMHIKTEGDFPTIPNGSSVVRWTGGVTRVDLIPRWWTI